MVERVSNVAPEAVNLSILVSVGAGPLEILAEVVIDLLGILVCTVKVREEEPVLHVMIVVEDVVLEELALSKTNRAHLDEVWVVCAGGDVETHPTCFVEGLDIRNGGGDAVMALTLQRHKGEAVVLVVDAVSNLGSEDRRKNGQEHFCFSYINTHSINVMQVYRFCARWRTCGAMDSAPDFGSGGCGFESRRV